MNLEILAEALNEGKRLVRPDIESYRKYKDRHYTGIYLYHGNIYIFGWASATVPKGDLLMDLLLHPEGWKVVNVDENWKVASEIDCYFNMFKEKIA